MASTKYTESFLLNMTPEQRQILEQVADAGGLTFSEVLRCALERMLSEARKRNANG